MQPGKTARGFQAQRAGRDDLRGASLGASDQGVQAGDQFPQIERLDQIVVGALVQPLQPMLDGITGGKDQHRQVGVDSAQRGHQFHPVAVGKAQIEHQRMKGFFQVRGLRRLRGAYVMRADAVLAQPRHDALADQLVIFHQQHTHPGFTSSGPGGMVSHRVPGC